MTKFQISNSVIEGLNLLNGFINEEITKKLIVNAVKQILVSGPALPIRSDIYDNEVKKEVKKAEFCVCCILLCAAQNSLEVLKLKDVLLNEYQINTKTVDQLIESYEKFKEDFFYRLSNYNTANIPNLVDIDYEVQLFTIPNSEEVFYKLLFKEFDNGETIIQQIICNQEELQLLISQLKDIERHCELISKCE